MDSRFVFIMVCVKMFDSSVMMVILLDRADGSFWELMRKQVNQDLPKALRFLIA